MLMSKQINELDTLTADDIVFPEQNYIVLQAPYMNGLKRLPLSDIIAIVRRLQAARERENA